MIRLPLELMNYPRRRSRLAFGLQYNEIFFLVLTVQIGLKMIIIEIMVFMPIQMNLAETARPIEIGRPS